MSAHQNSRAAIEIIREITFSIEKNIDYLTQLDQAIGDGDHGINLANGLRAVREKLNEVEANDLAGLLKRVGMMIVSNVGGTAGPLYGMAFMKAGEPVAGKTSVDVNDLANMFEAAEQGIIGIGKGSVGEKTMLDAIHPAVLAVKEAARQNRSLIEALEAGSKAAEEGMKSTINMVAKRGRASYLGERSRGHQDVGATSVHIMLESALATMKRLESA